MSAVVRRVRLYPRDDQQLTVGVVERFTINDGSLTIDGQNVRTRGPLPSLAREATVVCEAGRWFALLRVRQSRAKTRATSAVGIDLGVKHLAITSDGVFYQHHAETHRLYSLLRKYEGQVQRRTPGSPRHRESQRLVERTRQRILTSQLDCFHKVTTEITRDARLIAIEKFVIGPKIRANERYYRAVLEARWDLLTLILKRKAQGSGSIVVEVPPYYTSQTCSSCGNRQKLTLDQRWYDCPICRTRVDRDINASRVIRQLGIDKLTKR